MADSIAWHHVLFCVEDKSLVPLHGFIKKIEMAPQREMDLALRRNQGADV